MKHKSSFWQMTGQVVGKARMLMLSLVLVIAGSIFFALLPPLVLEKIVDQLINDRMLLSTSVAFYFGLLVLSGLFDAAKEVLITRFGQKLTRNLRTQMCCKLSRLPAAYFSDTQTGKITSRFVNDVDAVDSLFDNGIIGMLVDVCKMISIFAVIFVKSKGLGILLLIVTPLLFLLTRRFQKRMLAAQVQNRIAVSKVNNHVPETIRNIRMIHAFHKEAYMEKRYDDYIQEGYTAVDKNNFYDSVYSPIIIFSSSLVISTMMILSAMGGGMQNFFGMSVGSAVAVIAYVGKVFDPLESIGMEIQNIQSAAAGIKRIDEFLQEEERTAGAGLLQRTFKGTEEKNSFIPLIRFQNVTFGYTPDRTILKDFSCAIQPGEHVILAGRTGIGKSTLFKLLLGMYEPEKGTVTIGGRNAMDIPDCEKRTLFGYVEQNFEMVNGTVAEQITLFDRQIPRKQVEAAAQLAGLHEMILTLPQGYDTEATDAMFSQGQLQLLAIARAVVSNPVILLLDEITANLDSNTEQRVLQALDQAAHMRTVISISHRLAEKEPARRILELM